MPEFKYRAKGTTGNVVSSSVHAATREDAIEKICALGYYPLSVDDDYKADGPGGVGITFFDRISMKSSVTIFAQQLASLFKSGIPILKAVNIISDECGHKKFKTVLDGIFGDIRDGKSLAAALTRQPALFDKFFISMVHVGESNGTLPEVLLRLVKHMKKQDEIRSKIKGALIYPVLIGIVGFCAVFFIMTNVLPKIIVLIEGVGMTLPAITVLLIDTVRFFQKYSITMVIAVIIVCLLFLKMHKNQQNRLALDAFKLRLPVYGNLIMQSDLIRFARSLSASLESGLLLLTSLELSTGLVNNGVIKKELVHCYDAVKSGSSFGQMMKRSKVLPSMMSHMISVGEESGHITDTLDEIAEDYEWRMNETIRILLSLLEPMIILVLGGVVGFIVLALLLPIFNMDIMIK